MRIAKFPVKLFATQTSDPTASILVPEGSNFLTLEALPDGVYAFFTVPELAVGGMDKHTFWTGNLELSVPENAEFIKVINFFVSDDKTGQEGMIIYPMFKIK